MKRASEALNTDALTPIVERYDRGAYDMPRRNGLYQHPRTGTYYICRDKWEADSIGGYRYHAHWYKAEEDEAAEARNILDAWEAGDEPALPQTNADLWQYFVDFRVKGLDV